MNANWKNRTLFHGDNLVFLRAMNSESVDLIATDPPFNKSRDFHATPDSLAAGASFQDRWSWERDVHQDWVDKIQDDFPAVWEAIDAANAVYMRQTKKNLKRPREEVGSDMGAFLCFMAVRMLEMHRVLKPIGSIYLHCDPTASHYLKAIMDAVFGWKNFKNEIVWKRTNAHPLSIRKYEAITDCILFYSKSGKFFFSGDYAPMTEAQIDALYTKKDERGRFTTTDLSGGKAGSEEAYKAFNDMLPPAGRAWAPPQTSKLPDWAKDVLGHNYSKLGQLDKCHALDKIGLIYWTRNGRPRLKRYLQGTPQQAVPNLWADISPAGKDESTGYATQKPIILYNRIIRASSQKGSMVLDPFCGCATTCVAAELAGRKWVGIDIWDRAHEVVLDRFREEYFEAEGQSGNKLPFDRVYYRKRPPKRTDDGQIAVPFLKVKERTQAPKESPMKRSAMYAQLLVEQGRKCQGCDRYFDDPRYLELDHKLPRSDGGSNEISNRILLCGPCNRLKSNVYTLIGLRRKNKKEGYMAGAEGEHPIMKKYRESHRTAPRSLFE